MTNGLTRLRHGANIYQPRLILTVPIVETHLGPLIGYHDRTLCFRGVPYAATPLRYKAPRPIEVWDKRQAKNPTPASPQPKVMGMGMRGAPITSEDCLHLNIFTPSCDDLRRPVMVWIFGGGYINGDAGDALFDGQTLASNQNLVVVSINYRLGALGFLDHLTSNIGVRDQIAALEWIQANINHFGGDPKNVTLFGESAGGMSICNLLTMDASRGLFHRAIVQSGDGDNVATPEQARRTAKRFRMLTTLDAPIEEILRAQQQTLSEFYPVFHRPAFRPWIDGSLISDLPETVAAKGVDVPLIMGMNAHEQRLYVNPSTRIKDTALTRQVENRLAERCAHPEVAAKQVIGLYRSILNDENINAAVIAAVDTELNFRQPMLRYARNRGGNTWLYQFNWESPALRGWLKACHAIEIPFVFGNFNDPTTSKFVGKATDSLSSLMQSIWANFSRYGRPKAGWPEAPSILQIHPNIRPGIPSQADLMWDDLLK